MKPKRHKTEGGNRFTRRQFLDTGARALAGAVFTSPLLSLPGCAKPPITTDRSVPRVLADLHLHADINRWNRKTPLGIRYPAVASLGEKLFNRSGMDWKDCYDAGVDLVCATHFNAFDEWLSMPTDPDPEAITHTLHMIDLLERYLHPHDGPGRHYAKIARRPEELKRLVNVPKDSHEWRVAVVHMVEGGHALGGSLDGVASLTARGVASIGLTHFFNKGVASAANSYPFFPDASAAPANAGLSEFGRDLIHEMERHGIIVDVIHATSTAIEDILKETKRPMIASHSSVQALADHPYSLIDEHIEEIARQQGLIGVILDPYLLGNYATARLAERHGSLRDVVRTIRYLVKLVGHKHVGIGTDFGGYIGPPNDMRRVSRVGKLRTMLLDEFGNDSIVNDILANNVIDFMVNNWKPKV